MNFNEILTKEFLTDCFNNKMSSKDISVNTGINARTIRWYMKKNECPVLKSKSHTAWNKGLKASEDDRVSRSVKMAHKSRIGAGSWNKGIKTGKLSEEHKKKLSEALKGKYIGEKTSNWKGGVTKENKLLRRSFMFREWRTSVFKRDDYTCQNCKEIGGELHPHHIKPFATYIDLRFDVTNGLTLCKKCHIEEHKRIRIENKNYKTVNNLTGS